MPNETIGAAERCPKCDLPYRGYPGHEACPKCHRALDQSEDRSAAHWINQQQINQVVALVENNEKQELEIQNQAKRNQELERKNADLQAAIVQAVAQTKQSEPMPAEQTSPYSRAVAFLVECQQKGEVPTMEAVAKVAGLTSRTSIYRMKGFDKLKVLINGIKIGTRPARGFKGEDGNFDTAGD